MHLKPTMLFIFLFFTEFENNRVKCPWKWQFGVRTGHKMASRECCFSLRNLTETITLETLPLALMATPLIIPGWTWRCRDHLQWTETQIATLLLFWVMFGCVCVWDWTVFFQFCLQEANKALINRKENYGDEMNFDYEKERILLFWIETIQCTFDNRRARQ